MIINSFYPFENSTTVWQKNFPDSGFPRLSKNPKSGLFQAFFHAFSGLFVTYFKSGLFQDYSGIDHFSGLHKAKSVLFRSFFSRGNPVTVLKIGRLLKAWQHVRLGPTIWDSCPKGFAFRHHGSHSVVPPAPLS